MSDLRKSSVSPSSPTHTIQSNARGPSESDPLLPQKAGNSSESEPVVEKRRVTGEGVRNVATAVCLWLGYLMVTAAYSLFGPFFPEEAAAKGATPTMVGVIVSSSPLCVVFLAPVFGYLLPRLGLRFTLLAGLWLVGGPFILLGFMSSPQISSGWMFFAFCVILRMTEGVGSAMFFTAVFAQLPEMFPNHVGTVMGLFEVAAGLGLSIGPPLGGLLYQIGGFSLPFHVMGGLCLFSLVPYFFLVKSFDCKESDKSASWKVLKILGTNVMIILLCVANALFIAAISFLTPTLQPFLNYYFKLDPLHVGFVFLSGPLAYMVLSIFVGPLSDKLGHRGFILFGSLLYSISFVFLGPPDFISSPQLWITVVAFVGVGIGAAFGMVPVYADILQIAKGISPDDIDSEALSSVLSGVISSTVSFGEFMGPIVSGALAQYFDFQTSVLLFGEVAIAMSVLVVGVSLINRLLPQRKDHKFDSVN